MSSVGYILDEGNPHLNVAADQPNTSVVDHGKTIQETIFELGGTAFTKAHMSEVKYIVNTRPIVDLSGAQLGKISAYRGATEEAAYLSVPFIDRTGRDQVDQEVGALDSSMGITGINLDITIGAATAPTLKHFIKRSAPQMVRSQDGKSLERAPYAGMVSKYLRFLWQSNVSGRLPIHLPYNAEGTIIKRIHIEQTNNLVTGVECKEGSVTVHKSTDLLNEHFLKDHGLVPQTNWYSIDFVAAGLVKDAWDTRNAVGQANLFLDLSGADNGYIILEVIDRLDNL